jgi:hypothetical protein
VLTYLNNKNLLPGIGDIMDNEEIDPQVLISNEISIATKAAIDQMLLYFSQSQAAETLEPGELLKTYVLAIISTISVYMETLSYENRQLVESEIKKIMYDSEYTEQDMKLAKMTVMGNA